MDEKLWALANCKLKEAISNYEVDASCKCSQLHVDGTPYEVGFAFSTSNQYAKIIVDPFPELEAMDQRKRVIRKIESNFISNSIKNHSFLSTIPKLGLDNEIYPKRFWLALNLEDEEVEVYSSFQGEQKKQLNSLSNIMQSLNMKLTLNPKGFNVGPVSLSSKDNIITIYLRPINRFVLEDFLPEDCLKFLSVFSGKEVNKNGILISLKYDSNGLIGFKIDICGHCVTPSKEESIRIANELGKIYVKRPIVLPNNSYVSFWGLSWSDRESNNQKLYIYLVPIFDQE